MTQIRMAIAKALCEVMAEASEGETLRALSDEDVLLESGLDSLGFAILVARLDEELGFDPFSDASDPYYPVTFGDFVSFYEANQPS